MAMGNRFWQEHGIGKVILPCFLPAKPGKDGLPAKRVLAHMGVSVSGHCPWRCSSRFHDASSSYWYQRGRGAAGGEQIVPARFFSLFQSMYCQRENAVSSFFDYALSETIELICAGKRTEDDTPRASNHDTHFSHVHPRRGKRKENGGYESLQHRHGRSKSLL